MKTRMRAWPVRRPFSQRKHIGRNFVAFLRHDIAPACPQPPTRRPHTHNGASEGEISAGQISMLKLGAGSTFTLLAFFAKAAETSAVDSETTTTLPKTSHATSSEPPPRR